MSKVLVGDPARLVWADDDTPRVVFVAGRRFDPKTQKTLDLGELLLGSRDPAGKWRYSVLDGRVEGTAELSAAANSGKRIRVLFHNALTPEPGTPCDRGEKDSPCTGDTVCDSEAKICRKTTGFCDPQTRGSLQLWYTESKSAIWANPADEIGASSTAFSTCSARRHKRQGFTAELTYPTIPHPQSVAEERLDGAWIESMLSGVTLRNDPASAPLMREQVNVCKPDGCTAVPRLERRSLPFGNSPQARIMCYIRS